MTTISPRASRIPTFVRRSEAEVVRIEGNAPRSVFAYAGPTFSVRRPRSGATRLGRTGTIPSVNNEKSHFRDAWNRSSCEWRRKQEGEFAVGVLDPELWIETGDKILRGADLVRPALDSWWSLAWSTMPAPRDLPAGEYVADVYYMLLGFAAENYLKAGLVRTKLETFRQALEESANLPKQLSTHDLSRMVEELAGILGSGL